MPEDTRPHRAGRRPSARRMSEIARERILEFLFARRLNAGAFVSQNYLVELLDVPVAPLRDALRVLEVEGVLKIHPRSGIEFVKPGLELTRATYQFRTIIERTAVRHYAETAPKDELETLRADHAALARRLSDGVSDAEVEAEMQRLEDRLHGGIVDVLGNPLIEASLQRMHTYLTLVRLERRYSAPIFLRTLNEHLAILDACLSRDADAAESALEVHFTAALNRHMGMV